MTPKTAAEATLASKTAATRDIAELSPLSARVEAPTELRFPEAGHGLVWRGARRSDLDKLLELERAVDAVDNPESVPDLEDLEGRFDAAGFDPELDSVIAIGPEGNAVAHGEAYLEASGEAVVTVHLNGQVHPNWRRQGLGTAVLRWQEGRALQHLAASELCLPGMLSMLIKEDAQGQRALFAAEGFVPTRWWIDMERHLGAPIPMIELGDDLRIERYSSKWSEPARRAINDAFRDHWGSQPTVRTEWEDAQASEEFRAGWSAVAVATHSDGSEELVGAITVEADEEEWESYGYRFGSVDELGVLRAWRGRGVAQALLAWSMREMLDSGMERATLDVDGDSPTGAYALYEKLGFVETGRSVTYTKTHPRDETVLITREQTPTHVEANNSPD